MKESLPDSDEILALKKRARRRLIGAIVFVSFAAVVLPMAMDKEPPLATPRIELAIPAQEKGFVPPSTAAGGVAEPVPGGVSSPPGDARPPAVVSPLAGGEPAADKAGDRSVPEKSADKSSSRPVRAEAANARKDPAPAGADSRRARSILDGKSAENSADSPHVVLIGAFANAGNVQILQKKLGELGLRVYTEPLDTPQGKKTRVRVGPFTNRELAEKAVARMKTIGVAGVVAAKP